LLSSLDTLQKTNKRYAIFKITKTPGSINLYGFPSSGDEPWHHWIDDYANWCGGINLLIFENLQSKAA
jgi:hypothetical protein